MGHPKVIKFPFVLNVKLVIFRYPKILAYYSLIIMCSNIGTSKTINFPLMVLGVPIHKHFRVYEITGISGVTSSDRHVGRLVGKRKREKPHKSVKWTLENCE